MKNAKQVFRVGDRVRIVNPEFFVRCGYPFDKEYARNNLVSRETKNEIRKLVEFNDSKIRCLPDYNEKAYEKILDEIAYLKLCENGFGGRERKIFTTHVTKLKGVLGQVSGKRVVKTGTYCCASMSGYFEPEYEPAYLYGAKTHILLSIDLDQYSMTFASPTEIEECNVEKIKSTVEEKSLFRQEFLCEPYDTMKMDDELWNKI